MAFLTKKQRAEVRQRRRKKKLFQQPNNSNQEATKEREETEENPQDGEEQLRKSSGKRKRSSSDTDDQHKQNQTTEENKTVDGKNIQVSIRIPSNIISADESNKGLKKFRKDYRRKIRKKYPGILIENIVFHTDATVQETAQVALLNEAEGGGSGGKRRKTDDNKQPAKRKSSFPRINEILAQQKILEAAEKERQQRLEDESKIAPDEKMKYVALDCEMVGVGIDGKNSALARVSIVNWDHETVLDTFVTVPERVTDFRTWVSGVRAKDIKYPNEKTMELNACRTLVGNVIKDKIVVGHALKNDFKALMLDHPKTHVRDTARYKPYMRSIGKYGRKYRPRKLRELVEEKLGRKIQVKGESHDSTDDAIAALELYKLERTKWENEVAQKIRKKGK